MKIPRRRINKSALIMAVPSVFLLLVSIFGFSAPLQAADGNKLVFAYSEASVYQEVNVPNNWSTASTLTATVSAAEVQNWKASSDVLAVAIDLYGDGGGGIYSHSTGYITLTDGGTFNDYSVTVTAAGVGAGWASVTSVRISIIGRDGEFWAGNYGTQVETASLELDGVELLTNTEFATNSEWTSSLGWQTCSGGSGAKPCIGTSIPAPTALEVTSLLDDGSDGTLRWAINQANATAGGIYDAITITTEGTITLTSDLPAITEGVTITGTGMATTIIDGDNLYRSLNNNGTRTIAVSDVTFKRGKAANGGIGYTNNGGTFTFTRVKFTDMTSGSAWFQSNANVTTFTDSEFSALSIGIQSDYGSTPSALSQTDSDYTNRIYIDGSTFTNNTYGIRTERFVKINNSQFTDNTYGAVLRGLNRQQVLNSVFTSNFVGVNFSSWIPTSWTPGAGNQTVSGSTFNGNTYGIQFANNFNNGSTIYNDVSANSWSTSTGNTFGANAMNTANYSGTGYVTEGDTITAAFYNAVQNLTATANEDGSVVLNWGAPVVSNYDRIDVYVISFYDMVDGIQSGGWGVWTDSENMTYTLSTKMFDGTTGYGPVRFAVKAGSDACVGRTDPLGSCLYGPEATVDETVLDPTPVTTTTSSTTTTTTVYVPPVVVIPPVEETTTTTVYEPPVVVVPPDDTTTTLPQYPEPETESTTVPLPVEKEPEIELPTETIPKYSEPIETEPIKTEPVEEENPWGDSIGTPEEFDELPADATPEEIGAVIEEVDFTEVTDEDFDNTVDAVFESIENPEDVADVIGSFLEADISDEQFDAVLDKVFDGPMTANETTEILEELLDGPVTITQLETIMDKVFEDISDTKETVAVLTNLFDGPLSNEELDSVMEAVFSEDATVDQMADVMTDLLGKDLDVKELDAVFEAAFDGDLSDKETIDLIVDVLAEDLTSEALGSALGAVFDEEVSNEVLVETFTAVLGNELNEDSVEVIVDVLESDSISGEQVSTVVSLIIEQEGGVNAEQATELATSPKVLESISGEQATDVFDAVVVAEVSQEEGAEIVEALANAGTDVKESFEEEINVFAGVFDEYVALGSVIDVGDRRTVIAVGAATAVLGAIGASGATAPSSGPSAPSGGSGSHPGGSGGPSPAGGDVAARRNEEEEMNGEIAWDGVEWIKSMSIFRYNSGVRVLDWGMAVKKFSYGLINLGFTISGSLVVYLTLSGNIQKIAGISSVLALVGALYLHMREPE
jgi:hypothetical protein